MPAKTRAPAQTGLERPRLMGRLAELWTHPAALTIGPAGYGKTTLLTHMAATTRAAGGAVAWYQASTSESSAADLLRHLEHTLRSALRPDQPGAPWLTVEDAAEQLESWADRRTLLVIDDLHVLSGTAAEGALEQLIGYLPENVHLLVASRVVPGWNMSRLRISAMVVEINAEDLRFRLWEVDRLFREHYGQPLAPEECAELERRTEGWAGGLALFHLATRERTSADRHRVLARLADRPRQLREYLTHNVLAGLPDDLHEFMVRTSVLGCLNGPLCDGLLDRPGGEAMIQEIERRQLFLTSTDDGETWRFHEVLRSLLESVLVERIGEAAARVERGRAGHLLEAAGAWPEALHAYCRAEDWDAVRKLLVDRGGEMVEGELGWLDVLPAALSAQDPWVLLALARRHVATGRWQSAIEHYKAAELASFGHVLAARCQRERLVLTGWFIPHEDTAPAAAGAPIWASRLRRGLHREPLTAAGTDQPITGDPADLLARAALALVAGRPDAAGHLFDAATRGTEVVSAFARVGAATARWCTGAPTEVEESSLVVEALRSVPVPLVVALGDAVVRRDLNAVTALLSEAEKVWPRAENPWLYATAQLAIGLANLARLASEDDPGPFSSDVSMHHLRHAAECFEILGAEVMRSWALAFLSAALALQEESEAADSVARLAIQVSRGAASPGAARLAGQVLDRLGPGAGADDDLPSSRADQVVDLAARLWSTGVPRRVERKPEVKREPGPGPTSGVVEMHCFGRFEMAVDGVQSDLGTVRPKSRSLLRWLAMEEGRPVHRETITAGLWPNDDLTAATRKLHVAVTSLRQLLGGIEAKRGAPLVVREGQSYRLGLASDVNVDVVDFTRLMAEADSGRSSLGSAADAIEEALHLYAGDLLPEEGPADWVVEPRERLRLRAAEGAARLVDVLTEIGAPPARLITACERGLRIDRYSDALWKRMICVHESCGDVAKAARLRAQYASVLAELGV